MGMGSGLAIFTDNQAVVIEDYMFDASTAGELTLEASPSDFHDTWDLDGTDFMPEASPDDEGYWDDFENIVLNHNYEELGSELVASGTFSSFSVQSGDVTISGDTASCVDGGTNPNSRVSLSGLTANKTYKVVFSVTRYVAGNVQMIFGGGNTFDVNISAGVGTYTAYIVAGSSTSAQIKRNGGYANFDFDLTSISIKQVDPNDRWTLGTGWTISDGKANFNTTGNSTIDQDLSITPGTTYRIQITGEITSGQIKLSAQSGLGDDSIFTLPLDTYYTHDGGDNDIQIRTVGASVGYLDSVLVTEYAITPLDV